MTKDTMLLEVREKLAKKTVRDLRDLCSDNKIVCTTKVRKPELLDLLDPVAQRMVSERIEEERLAKMAAEMGVDKVEFVGDQMKVTRGKLVTWKPADWKPAVTCATEGCTNTPKKDSDWCGACLKKDAKADARWLSDEMQMERDA